MPYELDAIVLRGLARDPAERWASARQMAVAIERAVGVASPSEVGEWVDWIARAELAARASLLADVERASVELPVEVSVASAASVVETLPSSDLISEISTATSSIVVLDPEPPSRRESLPRAVLVGMMLASAFVIVVMTLRPRPMAAAHSPAPAPEALEPARPVSAASTLDVPAPTSASGASVTPEAADEPCEKALPVAPPVRHDARALASECDPPFTRDPRGHKRYKVRCL